MCLRFPLLLTLASFAALGQEDWRGFPEAKAPSDPALKPTLSPIAEETWLNAGVPHSPSTWDSVYNAPRNLRQTPSVGGSLGLLHLLSADIGPRGILRFGLTGEYFTKRDFPTSGASNTRTAGTFSLSFVPTDYL